jgi:hypothetical protein
MLLRFLEKLKDTIIFLVEIPVVLFRYVDYMFGYLVYNKIFLATNISLEYGNSSPIRIKRQQPKQGQNSSPICIKRQHPKQRTDNDDFGLGMHVYFLPTLLRFIRLES